MTNPPGRACVVERLRLFRFRNYAEQTLELGGGLTVVSGRNAQGKTTLLEAIATLALTRSPRAASAAELISWDAQAACIEARVRRPEGPVALDMHFARIAGAAAEADHDTPRATRTIHVDGKVRPARALLGVCPVVLFWPDDLALVKGGPEARRRLLDIVLSQLDPRVAAALVRYRRVLEQRNALLKQVRQGSAPRGALAGFSAALAAGGAVIQLARARLCTALQALAAAALSELSGGHELLELHYQPAAGVALGDDEHDLAGALAAALAARLGEELARGATLVGPHRDDVEILLDGRPARTTASQGQQRTIVLAVKLAEMRHVTAAAEMAPILLLDDVLSELDRPRRERLLRGLGLEGPAGQALLTTSEEALPFPELGAVRRLQVAAGSVRELVGRPSGAGA